MILLGYNFGKIGVGVLLISLAILIFIIAYRKLLALLAKGEVPDDKYCVLYSLETTPSKGDVEFYFTAEEPKKVTFELLDNSMKSVKILLDATCKEGGNIIHFDSTQVENGDYFYQLETENQKTIKKITIFN